MPIIITNIDYSPLVIDYEFEIVDEPLLASQVGELLIGNYLHIIHVINQLSSQAPQTPNAVITNIINKLASTSTEKRDGWLFQMISWLALVYKHSGERFFTQQPHGAPAHHGIDGLAIIFTNKNTIDKIIICEDKFTDNPRNLIQREVWPEFELFEKSHKDHVLVSTFSTILQHLNAGQVFQQIQNDIFNREFRVYRVGINRLETHNDEKGRKRLFADYTKCVSGDLPRRSGSTTFINDHKQWMENFSNLVIAYLNNKKQN